MIISIGRIESYAAGLSEADYLASQMTKDAVALNLLVLGEAARYLSMGTRERAPEVQWPVLRSIRHRIAHEYRSLNHGIVWDIIQERLPGLKARLLRLLEELEHRP